MRDDIHNRAPISAALRAVLKQALRPADQQRPDRLRDAAIKAVAKELEANIAPELLNTFRREAEQGDLFGPNDLSAACKSRLDADVVDHLKSNAQATMHTACEDALRVHLEGQCLEAGAGMIAAGGNRNEVQAGIAAFRFALKSAVPTAVQVCIEGTKPIVPDHTR